MFGFFLLAFAVVLVGAIGCSVNSAQPFSRTSGAPEVSSPAPDLGYAAQGYVQIAVTRRYAPHIDLHRLEQGFAAKLLETGCTTEQALAARWGGAYAVADDLANFDNALSAYKATADETGVLYNDSAEAAARMYRAAGLLVMTTAHVADPDEYGRFLRYIDADS